MIAEFRNDYGIGAHPSVIHTLTHINPTIFPGYGLDEITEQVAEFILQLVHCPSGKVHFFVGGTQTNLTVISSFLRPHEAVIAATSGHIFVHETGAIEATGHKIFAVETTDGKLRPEQIASICKIHTDEHMVKPKLVYISNPTELGTIYTKAELTALYQFCRINHLLLYLDGARLGAALTSTENDLTWSDLAALTDAFYIGGTKNGALFGEALVICKEELQTDFRFYMKQRGALLAKGWLLGLQFHTLFQNDLYLSLAKHANQMAQSLQNALMSLGYPMLHTSPTNQIFPIVPKEQMKYFTSLCSHEIWDARPDGSAVVRLVTSWATEEETIQNFIKALSERREKTQRLP